MTTPKTEDLCRADCTSGCHPLDCDHHGSLWPSVDEIEAIAAFREALCLTLSREAEGNVYLDIAHVLALVRTTGAER